MTSLAVVTKSNLGADFDQGTQVAGAININQATSTVAGKMRFATATEATNGTAGVVMDAAQTTSLASKLNTFLRVATSAVSRTLQDKVADFLHVKDFGAKIDGATDDAAAIAATRGAITSMGGKIYIPPGGIHRTFASAPGVASPVHWMLSGNCYDGTTVPIPSLGQPYDLTESFLDGGTKWLVRGSSTFTPVGTTTPVSAGGVLRIDGTHDYVGVQFTGTTSTGSPTVTSVTNIAQLQAGMTVVTSAFPSGAVIQSVNAGSNQITINANALGAVTGANFVASLSSGTVPVLQTNITLAQAQLANYVWGNQTILTSRAYGGAQHVATSSSVMVPPDALNDGMGGRAQIWSLYLEHRNRTGQGPALGGNQVLLEAAMLSNGPDTAPGGRVGATINIGQSETSFTFSGSILSGASTITGVTNVYNLSVGQPVSCPGVLPAGTVINFINTGAAQVAISNNATAAATNAAFTMVAPAMQCFTGLGFGASVNCSFGRVISAPVPFYGTAAIDLTAATSINGTPAIGLNDGLKIGFNAASTKLLSYSGSALVYSYGAGTFSLGDDGTLAAARFKSAGSTVANLPAATAVLAGARAHVTDATSNTYGAAVAGGGSAFAPVICTGSSWIIGG